MPFNIMDLFGPGAFNRLLQPAQQQGVQNFLANPAAVQQQPQMAPQLPDPINVGQAPAVAQADPWLGMREDDVQQIDPMMTGAAQAQPVAARPSPFGGLGGMINKESLNDIFTGWAMGSTPSESIAKGAQLVAANRGTRQNVNQTVAWLKGKGMDEQQAKMLAASPPALNEYLKSMVTQKDSKLIEINGQLVDPTTYKVIGDFRTPTTGEDKDTALIRELKAAGLKEGTPEFQEAILANNRPKGMMIESDGQGGFKMVQGTDVSGGANMNVEQGKNTGFLLRAQDADKVISGLESEGTSVWNNTAGRIPGVGNYLRGEGAQQFDQAKRDFINAQLRQESGAVISPEEFKNAEIQYFPQPGDSEKVIQQKRANRQNAISGFRIRSGPGAQSVDKMAGQDAASDPLGLR